MDVATSPPVKMTSYVFRDHILQLTGECLSLLDAMAGSRAGCGKLNLNG